MMEQPLIPEPEEQGSEFQILVLAVIAALHAAGRKVTNADVVRDSDETRVTLTMLE